MPANARSLAITDAYRTRMVALRTQAATVAKRSWGIVTLDDLDGTVRQWAQVTGLAVANGQLAAATLTNLYLAAYVASETGKPTAPAGVDLSKYEGKTEDGRPVTDLLVGAGIAVKVSLGYGNNANAALAAGLARGMRGATNQVLAAGRTSMDELTQADSKIIGWRRVAAGNACGVCLGAATGAIQADSEVLLCHDSCRCTKEPVIAGARDTVTRPTGTDVFHDMTAAQQDALFAATGGKAKADLIRSGDVALADLARTVPQVSRPDQLVEAPLEALATAR
jgi:hypothetical protein